MTKIKIYKWNNYFRIASKFKKKRRLTKVYVSNFSRLTNFKFEVWKLYNINASIKSFSRLTAIRKLNNNNS